MDETWILPLRKPRSGYATRTIKEIFAHLKATAAKLTAKEKQKLRAQINDLEWDRTNHVTQFFTDMEDLQTKIEGWIPGLDLTDDAVDAATVQMKESGMFDHKFMRDWEKRAPHLKTWAALKEYFTEEYDSIIQYDEPTTKSFESINSVTEQMMEEKRINTEQLQQMATSFKGATDVASEVMSRLKTALEEIKVLNKTVATLTHTNKQLVETIAAMGGKTEPTEKCLHCNNAHRQPYEKWCYKLHPELRPSRKNSNNEEKQEKKET
jgi:chromosome segregation ATPase